MKLGLRAHDRSNSGRPPDQSGPPTITFSLPRIIISQLVALMKIERRTFIVSGGSVDCHLRVERLNPHSSSSGLGLATVQDLLAGKAYVSIVDRAPPPSDLPCVKYFQTDITQLSEVKDAVEKTVAWTTETGASLGGVINCAGIASGAKIIDVNNDPHSLDLWEYVIAVNLTGTFNLTRLALKQLVKISPENGPDGERGVIIMVSSAAAVSAI